MKNLVVFLVLLRFAVADEIRVAAAANVGYVFEELKSEFLKDRPSDKISVTLASSGKLNSQIKAGADYAIFMAANMKFADELYESGFATNPAEIYARGVLVAFSEKKERF